MRKIRELLKEKRWRWTAGGIACFVMAAVIFALASGVGVQAETLTIGNQVFSPDEDGKYVIDSAEKMIVLGNAISDTNEVFKLTKDIEISISEPATGIFKGTFDGQGHVIAVDSASISNNTAGEVKQGLIFGTVTGTVTNVIIDFAEAVNYERVSSGQLSNDPEVVYVASAEDANIEDDASEIQQYPIETIEDITYKVKTFEGEEAKAVKTYTVESGNDYFGLLCGENQGTISEVYVTGSDVSITANASDTGLATTYEQAGTANVKYYYKESSTTETESVTGSVSLTGIVYNGNSETKEVAEKGLTLEVVAPQAVKTNDSIVYSINLNDSNGDGRTVVLSSSLTGTWTGGDGGQDGENNTYTVSSNATGITFTYIPENTGEVSANFTANVNDSTTSNVNVETQVVSSSASTPVDIAFGDNNLTGVSGTLAVDHENIVSTDGNATFVYTLALSNTNQSENITVSTVDWGDDWKNESTPVGDSVEIATNGEVTLTKTVNTTGYNSHTETLNITASISKESYSYKFEESKVVAGTFVAGNSEETAVSGSTTETKKNNLYTGGIAGCNTGTISQVKQSVNLTGEVDNEVFIGGIAGKAEDIFKLSDLYMLGKVDSSSKYIGINDATPATSTNSNATSELSDNWSTYKKYDSNGNVQQTLADLRWLVKTESGSKKYFTYSQPVGEKITVSLDEDAQIRDGDIRYTIAYNARRSIADTSESNIYVSGTDGTMELGKSGFYRILNAYVTDGYYHYCTPLTELVNAAFVYPYQTNNTQPYTVTNQKIVRSSENPLKDEVELTLSSPITGTLYYDSNSAGSIPYESEDTTAGKIKLTDSTSTVLLPLNMADVQYQLVYVSGEGYIYPMQITGKIEQSQKAPIPAPSVTCYDYYDAKGKLNAYAALGTGSYEAGTAMKLVPVDTTNAENYSFRYLYSTTAPTGNEWKNNRYTGNDAAGIMGSASDYTGSAVIPENLAEQRKVYLYVEISIKNYDSEIYCYGPFSVTAATELKATEKAAIVDGDTIELANTGTGNVEYVVSSIPITDFSQKITWLNYGTGITMKKSNGALVYARISYGNNKYSAISLFDYNFGEKCDAPRVTPNTGGSSAGEDGAAVIAPTTTVTISSRTPLAELFYLISNSQTAEIVMERTTEPADGTEDGAEIEGYKYFKIENRWYRTGSTEVQRYDKAKGVYLDHKEDETQIRYLRAIALAPGYEPSESAEYIYKVQPAQQVEKPEAAIETRYLPGGESIEIASVTLGAHISFYSTTPEAKLYYAIGTSSTEFIEMPSDGIVVEGKYGSNFVVRVKAEKEGMLDSEVIAFTYLIAAQERANAPTATPGTKEDVPTIVIPGNKILLSSATKGASIFYTTDGSATQIIENTDGTFASGDAATLLYDPNQGIEMPSDGSGYFTITAAAVKFGLAQSEDVHFTYAYPGEVLAPYANIDAGKVELNTKVILKNLTEGAVIYYNLAHGVNVPDDPTFSSTVFSEDYPFVITQKTTIKAMAAKDGIKSKIVTFIYEPLAQLAAPIASIESGSVVSRGTLLELTAASGATIYYTMDGSDPTDSTNKSVMSGNTLTLNGEAGTQITIKAYAKAADKSMSEVATFTYLFSQNTGGITASIESGSIVSNGTKVNLMSDVTGGDIYYTTDGSSPIEKGIRGTTVEINGTPGTSFSIRAVVIVNGEPGPMASFIYRIKEKPTAPTASPAGGTLTVAARVSLSSSGEKIYYTIDGTEPTKSSALYTEAILINRTTTLKAIGVSAEGEVSDVATFQYTAAAKAAEVVSTNGDGTMLNPGDTIALTTPTDGAVIYYSTDGTVPTVDNLDSMLIYDGEAIEINRSVTIQAVAYREDLRLSDVVTWNYIVDVIPAVEQKKEEAERLAEEGLRDTDATELARKTDKEEILTKTIREKEYNTAVSYPSDALPKKVTLSTAKEDNNPYTVKKVKGIFGEDTTILESYEIKVKEGTAGIQPTEKVEVAFQIPKGYEDAALTVALVDADYNLTTLETRREAKVLYAETVKLGNYVIIGPERERDSQTTFPYLLLLEIVAGATLFAGAGYYAKIKIKKYREKAKTTQTSEEQ